MMLKICMLICLITVGFSYGGIFIDDFNRDNDPNLNNGWEETIWFGDEDPGVNPVLYFDPQLSNLQGEFVEVNVNEEMRVYAVVSRTLPSVYVVSLDMKLSTANYAATDDARLTLTVFDDSDNSVAISLGDDNDDPNAPYEERIYISYNDVQQQVGIVEDYREFNNYKITVSDQGSVTVYFNDILEWQTIDGVLGAIVKADISATRWWRWHQFYFDNFRAVGDPESCEEVYQLGVELQGDINNDCEVNITDLSMFVSDWLKCNEPFNAMCVN